MAATKVWKKFRRIEKAGLIVLCVVMLMTLGIGGSVVMFSCDEGAAKGSYEIDGEAVEIDPADYREFEIGFHALMGYFTEQAGGRIPKITGEMIQRNYLLHRLAKHTGIEISDEALRQEIEQRLFLDRETNTFNRAAYDAVLQRSRIREPRLFEEAIRASLEIGEYLQMYHLSQGPTREKVFTTFKAQNRKYRVEYVSMPLEPFEKKVDEVEFTEEELKAYYKTVERRHLVPITRVVESAYVVMADVPDAEFEERFEKHTGDEGMAISYVDKWNHWRRNRHWFTDAALKAIEARQKGEDETPPDDPDSDKGDGTDDGTPPDDENADDSTDPAGDSSDGDEAGQDGEDPPAGEEPVPEDAPPVPEDAPPAPEDAPPAPEDAPPAPEGAPPVPEGAGPAPDGAEEPVPEEAAEPTAPARPVLKPKEVFETYWMDVIRKELFYQRMAERVLRDARAETNALTLRKLEAGRLATSIAEKNARAEKLEEGEELTALRKEIDDLTAKQASIRDEVESAESGMLERLATKYGLRFVRSDPLGVSEVQDIENIGCEDLQQVVNRVDKRSEGALVKQLLPTTNMTTEAASRGWQVVRVARVVPEHPAPFEEVEAKVRRSYREKRIRDLGIEAMNAIVEAMKAPNAAFAKAAKAQDLEVRTLPAFNGKSRLPAPTLDDLESEDVEIRENAEARSRDRFVMTRGLENITARLSAAVSIPLIDANTNSVILIHRIGTEDPGPEEMSQLDAFRIRQRLTDSETTDFDSKELSLETLMKRMKFEPPARIR